MVDYSQRLQTALDASKASIRALADAVGVSYQAVRKVLRGESNAFSAKNNDRAARFLNVSPSWLATGVGAMREKVHAEANLDHGVIQGLPSIHRIGTLLWEDLVSTETKDQLPALFRMAAPDGAMAPRLKQGVHATFERDLEPQFGDGVLVRDASGEFHIRIYRRGRPGTWEAHAVNEDYAPMVSDRDGLEVWGVLTAVEGRWA